MSIFEKATLEEGLNESLSNVSSLSDHYKRHVLQIFSIGDEGSRGAGWKSETFGTATAFNQYTKRDEYVVKYPNFVPFPVFILPKGVDGEEKSIVVDSETTYRNILEAIRSCKELSAEEQSKLDVDLRYAILDWINMDKKAYRDAASEFAFKSKTTPLEDMSPQSILDAARLHSVVGWESDTRYAGAVMHKIKKITMLDINGKQCLQICVYSMKNYPDADTMYLSDNTTTNKITALLGMSASKLPSDVINYKVKYFKLDGKTVKKEEKSINGNPKFKTPNDLRSLNNPDEISAFNKTVFNAKSVAQSFFSNTPGAYKIIRCNSEWDDIDVVMTSETEYKSGVTIEECLSGNRLPSMDGCLTYADCKNRLSLFNLLRHTANKNGLWDKTIDALIRVDKDLAEKALGEGRESVEQLVGLLHASQWDGNAETYSAAIEKGLSTHEYFPKVLGVQQDDSAGCDYIEYNGVRYYDVKIIRELFEAIHSAWKSGEFNKGKYASESPLNEEKVKEFLNAYIGTGMLRDCPVSSPIFIPLMRRVNGYIGFDLSEDSHYLEKGIKQDIEELNDRRVERQYDPSVTIESISEGMFRFNGREYLTEASRQQLLNKSRNAKHYKDISKGKNRYERRMKSKISATIRDYNNIEMDQLFKRDIFEIKIPVMGETDVYEVHIKINGLLKEIQKEVQSNKGVLEFKVILQSLMRTLNAGDVYIGCQCPDFRYRMRFWATQNGYVAGGKETRPSDKTNPHDDLGAACKHVLLILNNLSWCLKVAAVVHNYIRYCQTHLEQEYADYIFPRIYGIKYDKAVQMNLFYDGFLPQDKRTRDEITKNSLTGRDARGRFQPYNPYRFHKSDSRQYPEDNPNQLKLNIEGPIEKELIGEEDETRPVQSLN